MIGPNGSGKTTVFNLITGIYRGDRPAASASTDGTARAGRAPVARHHRARHRAHLSEPAAVQPDDGAGERAGRQALPDARGPRRRSCSALPACTRREAAARERGDGAAGALRRAAAAPAGSRPRRSPTPTAGASRSRGRWRPSRACCCSTSRPPGMNPTETRELMGDIGRIRDRGVDDPPDRARHGAWSAASAIASSRSTTASRSPKAAFETVRSHPAVLEAYLGRRAAMLRLAERRHLLRADPGAQGHRPRGPTPARSSACSAATPRASRRR